MEVYSLHLRTSVPLLPSQSPGMIELSICERTRPVKRCLTRQEQIRNKLHMDPEDFKVAKLSLH